MSRFLLCLLCLSLSACGGSNSFLDGTHTASYRAKRGIRSLFGTPSVSRQIHSKEEFTGPPEESFIPFDESTPHSVMKSQPGESKSSLPGIKSFSKPAEMGLERIFRKVFFRYDDYSLQGEKAFQSLDEISRYLRSHPNLYVYLEGHCDEKGSASYNIALGMRRSNTIKNALIAAGVSAKRLFTVSYGKEHPADRSGTIESRKRNRRVEFRLYKEK